MATDTTVISPVAGIRFAVASRMQRRFSATQTASNLNGSTSFQPISLPATGFVTKISMLFTVSCTSASAGAIVAGDGPTNLISAITFSDATGQPIVQPISGFNLGLVNKWLPSGPRGPENSFQMGPEYAYSSTGTTGTAVFRLDLELAQDNSGYMAIPNLDSNASLQLKIDLAPITVAFSGTTMSAATVSVRVTQHYWAPVGASSGGVANMTTPPGFGDYLETRYENQTATASSENTVAVTNRGGLVKGIIAVSRAAGVRTAFTPGANVGVVYDNNAVDEGLPIEEFTDQMRRDHGYLGAGIGTSYAPLSAGLLPGLETGVLAWNFGALAGGRDAWLSTRVGTLLQLKATPGAAATQLELITQLAQVKDAAAFYNI